MSKVRETIHESRSVVRSVSLSNGGFVELELSDKGDGYLKVHVGKCESIYMDHGGAWRWIQHGNDKKNIKTLIELRDACDALVEALCLK